MLLWVKQDFTSGHKSDLTQTFQINMYQHPLNIHVFWFSNSHPRIHTKEIILSYKTLEKKFVYIDVCITKDIVIYYKPSEK